MEGRIVNTYARYNNVTYRNKTHFIVFIYLNIKIIAWMDDLTLANPSFISQYTPGKSYQNRDIRVLVIKVGSPSKSIWIDCGIHAREWISHATCISLIDKV